MKKKLCFIVLVLGIIIASDWTIGVFSMKAIREVKDIGSNQTNSAQVLFNKKADVLILGSSRANHSFDCNIVEKELGMTCYNAGRDGMNIMYDGMVFFSFLQRHTPKLVVLDVADSMLDATWNDSWRDMVCFYGMTGALDEIIDSLSSPIEKIQLMSNIYRYNKTWEWLLNAQISAEQSHLSGYRPMPVQADHPQSSQIVRRSFTADSGNVEMLNRIVKACQMNHIVLLLTYTPSLNIDNGNFHQFLKEYGKKNHLMVLDWNGDTTYTKHPEWFYDMTHLNKDGATVLTKDFTSRLNKAFSVNELVK